MRKQALASPTTHPSFMRVLSLSKTKRLSKRLLERLTALYHSPYKTDYKIFLLFVFSFFPPSVVLSFCIAKTTTGKAFIHLIRRKSLAKFIADRPLYLGKPPIIAASRVTLSITNFCNVSKVNPGLECCFSSTGITCDFSPFAIQLHNRLCAFSFIHLPQVLLLFLCHGSPFIGG